MKIDGCEVKRAMTSLEVRGWLADQPEKLRQLVMRKASIIRVANGDAIYQHGDNPTGLYGLAEGGVKFSSFQENGSEIITSIGFSGTWFGELSVLDNLPRHHSTIAISDSLILHLPIREFKLIIHEYPEYLGNFIGILSRNLRATMLLRDILAQPPRIRLKQVLGFLASQDGDQQHNPIIQISQEQLAKMIGLSRQTANQILRSLEEEGQIKLGYGTIVVSDMKALLDDAC